jgi:membrane protein
VARTRGIEVLFEPIFETAPAAVATIGRRELERLAQTDFTTAPLALVGFLWLASSGVHGMMDAFERALAVPVRRPFWKKRLYSLGFVVFGLMAAALVSFAAVGIESITAPAASNAAPDSEAVVDAGSPSAVAPSPTGPASFVLMPSPEVTRKLRAKINRALAIGCFLVLSVSGVAVFYRFAVEYPRELRRRVWPGAMLAIALWLLISWGFGLYVTSLGQYTLYYGSLAAVAVLLMWFWLTSLALLIGAELNAQLEGSRI